VEQPVYPVAPVWGEIVKKFCAIAAIILAQAMIFAGEAQPPLNLTDNTIQSLVLKLQKTGPAEAVFDVKVAGESVADVTFAYAHPALRLTIRRNGQTLQTWLNGLDAYSRPTPDAVLYHYDFREIGGTLKSLEPMLKLAFDKAAALHPADAKRTLEEAWKANLTEVARIGVVVDIRCTLTGDKPQVADVEGYVHINPKSVCPFGWLTFPEKIDTNADGSLVFHQAGFSIVLDALTGWPMRAEWKNGDQVYAVMERKDFRTLEKTGIADIMPPEWERKAAVEERAFKESGLARIAAMPLWMYVKEVSDSAGDTLSGDARSAIQQIAYYYYAAVLERILGKDFIIESSAVLREEMLEGIEELKKPPEDVSVEEAKQISDKLDRFATERLNTHGRALAQEGFTGVDFVSQLVLGTQPKKSFDDAVKAVLEGFSKAYNDQVGMPIHGIARWYFRRHWLEPSLREDKKQIEELDKATKRPDGTPK
jgi:hypothetical protein